MIMEDQAAARTASSVMPVQWEPPEGRRKQNRLAQRKHRKEKSQQAPDINKPSSTAAGVLSTQEGNVSEVSFSSPLCKIPGEFDEFHVTGLPQRPDHFHSSSSISYFEPGQFYASLQDSNLDPSYLSNDLEGITSTDEAVYLTDYTGNLNHPTSSSRCDHELGTRVHCRISSSQTQPRGIQPQGSESFLIPVDYQDPSSRFMEVGSNASLLSSRNSISTTSTTHDRRTSNCKPALHLAAENDHVHILSLLLESGARIDDTDEDGQTALHLAASLGHRRTVSLLLSRGANCNAVDEIGWTPLHMACEAGHVEVVELLLRNGADPHAKGTGNQPLLIKSSAADRRGLPD